MSSLPPANEVCEGYVFTPVCHSVQGGCLPLCMLGYTPLLGADTPPGADTPGSRHPPEQTSPWEQTPPHAVHAGRYGQ